MAELRYQFRYALPYWLIGILTNWWPENRVTQRLRGTMVSRLLGTGPGLKVAAGVRILGLDRLTLGEHVYLGPDCWINAIGGLQIDGDVMLGPHVCISTTNHRFAEDSVRLGGTDAAPVVIGFGSWLAAHAVVTAGVEVGRGCVVAANSVVTTSTEDHVVLGGVPAKRIADRENNPGAFSSRREVNG